MGFDTFYSTCKLIGDHIVFKVNRLLAFKIDWQLYNRRKFFMDGEFKQLDNGLCKIDITDLQIYFDLVQPVLSLYFNCCFVRFFVNIFINIFYNFDYSINLDININIVFIDKIQIIRDNKTVIKINLLSIDSTDYKLVVIISAID